jgi:hypothetical protein
MNKKILLLVAFVMGVVFAYAQSKENRNVGSFNRIDFRLPGTLFLKQGGSEKVEIEASKETLGKIQTEVEGDKLIIHVPGRWNWSMDDKNIKVYVTVKNLEGVSAAGSGDIIGESNFSTGDLDLRVSGSGSLKISASASGRINADVSGSGELIVSGSSKSYNSDVSGSGKVVMNMEVSGNTEFSISGSGKIEPKGSTDVARIHISGSGKVLGADFQTKRTEVRISGSGDVEISVKDEIDSQISGSGTVSYKGNPSKVNNSSSGSGRLTKL